LSQQAQLSVLQVLFFSLMVGQACTFGACVQVETEARGSIEMAMVEAYAVWMDDQDGLYCGVVGDVVASGRLKTNLAFAA